MKDIITLSYEQVEAILQERRVLIEPCDDRDAIAIAEALGYVTRVRIGEEQTGIFERSDVARERRHGRILTRAAFGVYIDGLVPVVEETVAK